jgi:hypothetical protein
VPRLGELYPGICLTTEEKARKNLSQGRLQNGSNFMYFNIKWYEKGPKPICGGYSDIRTVFPSCPLVFPSSNAEFGQRSFIILFYAVLGQPRNSTETKFAIGSAMDVI